MGRLVLAAYLLVATVPLPAQQTEMAMPVPPHWLPRQPQQARAAHERAWAAEQRGDWKQAFVHYAEAWRLLPSEPGYLYGRERARFALLQQHLERADRFALAREFRQARSELLAALALDPTEPIARERLEQIPPQSPVRQQPPARSQPVQVEAAAGTRSFHYSGDVRGAYEEVGRAFGVTVSFDSELTAQTIRFRAENVDFTTALRLLGQQTKTWWVALDRRLIHILPDTPQKRQESAPRVERRLFLPNLITPESATEAVRVVSEIVGITQVQADNRTHALLLRGHPEAVALAEALLQDLEQAQGELMLEVHVVELNRSALRQLGITPPTSNQLITLRPDDITEAQQSLEGLLRVLQRLFGQSALSGLTPEQIAELIGSGQLGTLALIPPLVLFGGGRSVFLATLPQAAAEFSENFNVLRRSRRLLLRAQDGQPTTFFLGERFPVTIGRLTPALVNPSLLPLLGPQLQAPFPAFQFEDLGLRVRATPRMHSHGEVTLQLEIEIRSLTGVELNGIPVISNRTVQQTVRLRQDESSVIAGILQQEERLGIRGWPGLARVPGAGALTGSRENRTRDDELLLVITPRALRLAPRTGRSLYAGREAELATPARSQ
ncbi:MAG: hypothetical protein K6U02_02520 [Firmicutes bacterium]|nr:hypothetical protein [Bacillota bacterium]